MHELIQVYGNQIVQQALDDIFIHQKTTDGDWRFLLIKKGLIRQSTKTIKVAYGVSPVNYEYQTINGIISRVRVEPPYKKHTFIIRNGRNSKLFRIIIKSTEIPQLLEELSNETNQTSEHGEL